MTAQRCGTVTYGQIVTTPQVVDRGPNLSPYRARKAPEAVEVHLCGYGSGLLVVRCHDVDVANLVAFGAWLAVDSPQGDAWRSFVAGDEPELAWVRWVPDDPHRWDELGSYERELRGTIGATPAVLFARHLNPVPS